MIVNSNQIKADVRESLPFRRLPERAAWLLYVADRRFLKRRDEDQLFRVMATEEPDLAHYLIVRKIAKRIVPRPFIGEEASV